MSGKPDFSVVARPILDLIEREVDLLGLPVEDRLRLMMTVSSGMLGKCVGTACATYRVSIPEAVEVVAENVLEALRQAGRAATKRLN